jgi:FdhD protein
MTKKTIIKRFTGGNCIDTEDTLIQEHRAHILVNGEHYITLLCLPQFFEELAVGFLFSENIISAYSDIKQIRSTCTGYIFVVLEHTPKIAENKKRVLVSGCAGGSVNLAFLNHDNVPEAKSNITLTAEDICTITNRFSKCSPLFEETGGVHSCALEFMDAESLFCEDIARHNAIDKIVGMALMRGIAIENGILLTSGRVSSEILLKTARLGISVLVSHSAPTDMAVEIARKINMTLIGFARGSRFNVYSGDFRIKQ